MEARGGNCVGLDARGGDCVGLDATGIMGYCHSGYTSYWCPSPHKVEQGIVGSM